MEKNSQKHSPASSYPGFLIHIFHWSLFFSIVLLYFTDSLPLVHADLGYLAFFLVLFRIIWGTWGKSDRLIDYPLSFAETFRYFKGVFTWKPVEYPKVNPASAWVAILFYIVIILLTITGVITLAVNHYEGIWVESLAFINNDTSLMLKKLHFFLSGLLLALMGFHIFGAILSSVQHRRNVIKSMLLGSEENS